MPDEETRRHLCPTCGSTVTKEAPILVDLNDNSASNGRERVRLTPREAEIVHTLARTYPARITPERLFDKVYGLRTEDVPELRSIYVQINYVRKKLAALGIGITVRNRCGGKYDRGGYRLYRLPRAARPDAPSLGGRPPKRALIPGKLLEARAA